MPKVAKTLCLSWRPTFGGCKRKPSGATVHFLCVSSFILAFVPGAGSWWAPQSSPLFLFLPIRKLSYYLWPNISLPLKNVPRTLEKSAYSAAGGMQCSGYVCQVHWVWSVDQIQCFLTDFPSGWSIHLEYGGPLLLLYCCLLLPSPLFMLALYI